MKRANLRVIVPKFLCLHFLFLTPKRPHVPKSLLINIQGVQTQRKAPKRVELIITPRSLLFLPLSLGYFSGKLGKNKQAAIGKI